MPQTELINFTHKPELCPDSLTLMNGSTHQPSYQVNNLGVIITTFPSNFPFFPYNKLVSYPILDLKILSHLCLDLLSLLLTMLQRLAVLFLTGPPPTLGSVHREARVIYLKHHSHNTMFFLKILCSSPCLMSKM